MTESAARQTTPTWQDPIWRDPARPAEERVAALLREMTLVEKLASIWMGAGGEDGEVAPMQDEMIADLPPLDDLIRHGMGHLTPHRIK